MALILLVLKIQPSGVSFFPPTYGASGVGEITKGKKGKPKKSLTFFNLINLEIQKSEQF